MTAAMGVWFCLLLCQSMQISTLRYQVRVKFQQQV